MLNGFGPLWRYPATLGGEAAVSITATMLSFVSATYAYLPSGVKAIDCGALPVVIDDPGLIGLVEVSTGVTLPSCELVIQNVWLPGWNAMPYGSVPGAIAPDRSVGAAGFDASRTSTPVGG